MHVICYVKIEFCCCKILKYKKWTCLQQKNLFSLFFFFLIPIIQKKSLLYKNIIKIFVLFKDKRPKSIVHLKMGIICLAIYFTIYNLICNNKLHVYSVTSLLANMHVFHMAIFRIQYKTILLN